MEPTWQKAAYRPITLSSAELIGNSGEGSLLSTALTLHYAH